MADTVKICHFDSEKGAYEVAQAPETDFYGAGQQGHGEHAQDIVPPFVVEIRGRATRVVSAAVTGTGRRIYDNGCDGADPVAPPEPSQGSP